jgi:Flp pilus assembly protein TadG
MRSVRSRPSSGLWQVLLTDRRGATAVMFAVTSIALAGMVGLGAEAGNWYVMKRAGQNAADAAAIAGALALGTASGASGCIASLQTTAATSGTSVASANGFTSGSGGATVTVQAPPWNGSYTSHPCATEAQIAQVIPTVFASVIPGVASSMTVNNAAVAEVVKLTPSCALALNQIIMNGASTTISGTNCGFEANSTAGDALQLNGNNSSLTGTALATPGGCTGTVCTSLQNLLTHAIPGVNPFTAIYNPSTNTGLSFSTLPCLSNGTGHITVSGNKVSWTNPISPSWTGSSEKAYCGGNGNGATLTVDNNNTPLTFSPGTYIFSNISLSFTGGTISCPTCTCPPATTGSNCTGVTIILTGPSAAKIGTLKITAGATVTLAAPNPNSASSAFNTVLFYMDYNAPDSTGSGNAKVDITGGGGTVLWGGMYFPSVTANWGGNSNTTSTCTDIVGKNLTFGGNSTLNVSGCPSNVVSQVSVLKMLQ